jgi:hypothetical protein
MEGARRNIKTKSEKIEIETDTTFGFMHRNTAEDNPTMSTKRYIYIYMEG